MKKRKESFFGVHLDYHAKPQNGVVQGINLKEDDIRDICRILKPDFIQIDCKGHPGWASYPTKIGNAMPEFEKDTLALWRKVTKEENVALYMHYSGVYDIKYCSENNDQTVQRADGTLDIGVTRLDGRYADDILIPQLKELSQEYGVDGVWIDGECWTASPDYHDDSIEKFEKETGIRLNGSAPAKPSDPYYNEYREYFREQFRAYLRRYVDILHKECPNLEIASNWAFSDHMPERVCANVDFLSGDLDPNNSFNSARYAGRALASQEHPWDLMSWNFRIAVGGKKAYASKHPNQIMQEAAAVIALGGAYQDYIPQHNDGSPNMVELKKLDKVSEFVRTRRDFCFRGRMVHQAALLLSTYNRHRESSNLFSRTGSERVFGMSALLCDIGESLEIVSEHTLEKYINDYKMIVVPELAFGLANETKKSLLTYAKLGGNLVLIGKHTCKLFAECDDVPFKTGEMAEYLECISQETANGHVSNVTKDYMPYLFTIDESEYGALFSPISILTETGHTVATAKIRHTEKHEPIVAFMTYGKGSITAVGFDIGEQYLNGTQYMHRKLMKKLVSDLYPHLVRIEESCGPLEVVALEKDGELMLQLVNASGSHASTRVATDDYIPPVLDIKMSVELSSPPKKLILQPQGKELSFEYRNSRVYFNVDRVDVHEIVEIVR